VKKVIDKLEKTVLLLENCIDVMENVEGIPGYYLEVSNAEEATALINEVIAELKTPYNKPPGDERRIQCNWCESVFDERHIKVVDDIEYYPVCGDPEYLMDIHCMDKPRFYTPEQWEKKTGEVWPDNAGVFVISTHECNKSPRWELILYSRYKFLLNAWRGTKNQEQYHAKWWSKVIAVCATEAGSPPDDWKPDE
jgi:hypothetical protein